MKTDLVLTMNEYLDAYCGIPKHVNPPAADARHIPIAEEKEMDIGMNARSCNCDRWGHPCPDCVERKPQTGGAPRDSTNHL